MSLATLCFALSALGISTWRGDRWNLRSAGLVSWALAVLFG
jgi:hypothetical protein